MKIRHPDGCLILFCLYYAVRLILAISLSLLCLRSILTVVVVISVVAVVAPVALHAVWVEFLSLVEVLDSLLVEFLLLGSILSILSEYAVSSTSIGIRCKQYQYR